MPYPLCPFLTESLQERASATPAEMFSEIPARDFGPRIGPKILAVSKINSCFLVTLCAWVGSTFTNAEAQSSLTWDRGNTTYPLPLNAIIAGGAATTTNGPELIVLSDHLNTGDLGNWVVRWNPTLGWRGIGPPYLNDTAYSLQDYDDGNGQALYVCGRFSLPRWGIARTRGPGGWEGLMSASGSSAFSLSGIVIDPRVMAVHDDGTGPGLYIAGRFSQGVQQTGSVHTFVPSANVIRFDSTGWHALGVGISEGEVYSLCTFDDGSGPALFVGGEFQSIAGQPIRYIARWRGGAWSAAGSIQADFGVKSLAVFDDGSGPALYASARFGTASPQVFLQKWDGSQWTAPSPQPGGGINDMLVFDDGRGPGLFCSIVSTSAPSTYIGRWDGHSWTGLGQGLHYYGSGFLGHNLAVYDAGRGPELNVVDQVDTVGGGLPSRAIATWRNLQPGISRLCPGDRTFAYCPCFSFGANDRGCPNSFDPGGADLSATGMAQDDSLTLVASAMPPNTATLLFQGDSINASAFYFAFGTTGFGDGLRCASGNLLRLYTKLAVNGQITVPDVGDLSLRARANMLHDPLPAGASRVYQAWYRDPAPAFCDPAATWNVTNAIRVVW